MTYDQYRALIAEDGTALEALVDKYSIETVIEALSQICSAKAEHIATNWQDAHLAKRWMVVSATVDKAVFPARGL